MVGHYFEGGSSMLRYILFGGFDVVAVLVKKLPVLGVFLGLPSVGYRHILFAHPC